MYWLDPFTYLVGGILSQLLFEVEVTCEASEYVNIPLPPGQTCGDYMSSFLGGAAGYVLDGNSTASCQYCAYQTGGEYAETFNLKANYYGWRDTGITFLFCIASYALVLCMMKLRTKATKQATG
jgi:ABC-type multidrug transport system permease subunit